MIFQTFKSISGNSFLLQIENPPCLICYAHPARFPCSAPEWLIVGSLGPPVAHTGRARRRISPAVSPWQRGHHDPLPCEEAKAVVTKTWPDELGIELASMHGGAAAWAHGGRSEQATVAANEASASSAR
jgi:hypothetical protein